MDIANWLARCARCIERLRTRAPDLSDNDLRRAANRSLRTRLPPHIRKDVGADDG